MVVVLASCGGGGTKSAVKSSATTAAPGAQPPTNTPTSASQSTTAVPAAKGSWTDTAQVNAANPNTTLVVVECATATFCIAVDEGENAFTFNGSAWSGPTKMDPLGSPNALSCPSPTACIATDLQGNAMRFDGSSWTAPQRIDPGGIGLNGSSCPTPTFCVAVDDSGNAFTFNGSSWTAAKAIDPAAAAAVAAVNNGQGLDVPTVRVDCPAAGSCVVVDSLGNTMALANGTWSAPAPIAPGTHKLLSLSCASATSCVSGEQKGFFTFDGTKWTAQPADQSQGLQFGLISCPTPTFCMAGKGHWATFDGSKWTTSAYSTPGPTGNDPQALDCPTADFCIAVSAYGKASTFKS